MRKARDIRIARGHASLRQFAKQLGIDPSSLSDFEQGKPGLGIGNIQKVANALEVTIDELLEELPTEQMEPV